MTNADPLYGLAAECALKAVVVGLGEPTEASGDLGKPWRHQHANAVWDEYQTLVSARTASRYLAPLDAFGGNPFADWSITQRYGDRASSPSAEALERHANAARACLLPLQRAMYDGIVTWTA